MQHVVPRASEPPKRTVLLRRTVVARVGFGGRWGVIVGGSFAVATGGEVAVLRSSAAAAQREALASAHASAVHLVSRTLALQSALDARDKLYEKIAACMELRTNCQQLLERGQRELKTMVNLGSDFYVQAHVPDTGWIYVDVGLGFPAQMTLDEACAFAPPREAALNARAAALLDA